MNDDLRPSLDRAVDAALDQAVPAEQMRRSVTERIRAKRRRRPALIIGTTVSGLALVGGTAFGATHLLGGDDHGRAPDVIGSPHPGRPTPSPSPTAIPTTEPAPPPVVTFPVANPSAKFPECGSLVELQTGVPMINLTWELLTPPQDVSVPLGQTVNVHAWGGSVAAATGEMTSTPTLVAVRDGVVVGSSVVDQTQTPFELYSNGADYTVTTGTVLPTLCTDNATPLPQGRYSIWASQEFAFTGAPGMWDEIDYGVEVTNPPPPPYDPVVNPYRAKGQVATLWMDDAGQPVASPGLAAGWPAALSREAAFGTGSTQVVSVVWFAVTNQFYPGYDASLVPSREALADLGYLETEVPLECQVGLSAIGVDQAKNERGFGTALAFTTPGEAQAFVELWEPLHGPILGVVTTKVGHGALPIVDQDPSSDHKHCGDFIPE